MKKGITAIFTAFLLTFCIMTVCTADTVCGSVLHTDIRAYIDGLPIRSYNIDGWTGICAEDLRAYGFNVLWDEENRKLYVGSPFSGGEITADYQFEENTMPVGSHAAYVYETDIKTYVGSKEVNAFNIGGYTIIYIDDLMCYGDVIWSEEKREISYSGRKPWNISFEIPDRYKAEHEVTGPYTDAIKGVKGTFVKNADGEFDVTSENLNHLSYIGLNYDKSHGGMYIEISMVAHHLLADSEFSELLFDMLTINNTLVFREERLKENADLANEHTEIYINDKPIMITEVGIGKGNNNRHYYFLLDCDVSKEDVQKVVFECRVE